MHKYADDVKLGLHAMSGGHPDGHAERPDADRRLELFRSLHAIARTGLHFCRDEYDRERYGQVERVAAELLAGGTHLTPAELQRDWAAETGYVDA